MSKAHFSIFLALMFIGTACQDVVEQALPEESAEAELSEVTFHLAAPTKTALSGTSVVWDASDKVSVFDGKANRRFIVSGSGATADITGRATYASSYVLMYPYYDSAECSSSVVSTLLPEVQYPVVGSFDPRAHLLCAKASSYATVTMKNACGLLGFTLSGTDVSSVKVITSGADNITGNVKVSVSDSPVISGATSPVVSAYPAEGDVFAPGTYYLCLAPATAASGIKVQLLKSDGTLWERTFTSPLTIERSTMTTISGNLDDSASLKAASVTPDILAVNTPHPRLFATPAEFDTHKEAVLSQKSRILYLMHNEVIATAIRCVNRADKMDNTLDASGKRMLDMARDAFGRIFMCAYAYRFTGEQRYLDCAEDLLNQICDFPDWNKQNHYLDTATLTHAAAVGYDWLYDVLSDATKAKVEQKVFEYCLSGIFTDASSYINPSSGWNTTITSAMILGGMAFYEINPDLCNKLLVKAIPSNYDGLRYLLGTDGSDPMGTMYWRNFVQMEMLSVSALKSLYMTDFGTSDYEGYRNTPIWYLHLIGSTGRTFRYGDNNDSVDTVPANMFFSVLFGDPSVPYFELDLASRGKVITGGVRVDGGTAINMRTYPLALLWTSKYETADYHLPEETVHAAIDGAQPVVTARTGWDSDDQYLAIKGGRANLNHAHMDAGSFCYEAYGVRWVDDPVQDSYADLEKAIAELNCGDLWDRTDGSARYQAFRINCRQHSTICINDKDHLVAGDARFVSVSRDENAKGGTVDMGNGPLKGQVKSATRTALIKDGSYLSVTDDIAALDGEQALVRWNIETQAVPTLRDDGILLTSGSVSVLLQAQSSYPVEYKIFPNDPAKAEHPAPFCAAEEYRDYEYYCGFTLTIPAGQTDSIEVTFKRQ